jgi:endonuclease YncB( thermonuclease family)
MIADGWAWEFDKYSKSDTLDGLESSARSLRVGLWSGTEPPIPPWEFRKQKE